MRDRAAALRDPGRVPAGCASRRSISGGERSRGARRWEVGSDPALRRQYAAGSGPVTLRTVHVPAVQVSARGDGGRPTIVHAQGPFTFDTEGDAETWLSTVRADIVRDSWTA